ncbi:MAG TPA: hypothetical protein VKR06_40825 [Ktedonosporobacter sp.]|nr:hypothetical protein [Ktedonosporobacter sp.]
MPWSSPSRSPVALLTDGKHIRDALAEDSSSKGETLAATYYRLRSDIALDCPSVFVESLSRLYLQSVACLFESQIPTGDHEYGA